MRFTGDRPWSELTEAEQDELMAEAGQGAAEEIDVPDVPAERWTAELEDSGDHDPEDTYTEDGGAP